MSARHHLRQKRLAVSSRAIRRAAPSTRNRSAVHCCHVTVGTESQNQCAEMLGNPRRRVEAVWGKGENARDELLVREHSQAAFPRTRPITQHCPRPAPGFDVLAAQANPDGLESLPHGQRGALHLLHLRQLPSGYLHQLQRGHFSRLDSRAVVVATAGTFNDRGHHRGGRDVATTRERPSTFNGRGAHCGGHNVVPARERPPAFRSFGAHCGGHDVAPVRERPPG
mmetsp:Transcript_118360/g.334464  ORF Transcript_118360/g.334464 Transcript_118360/m.334464 type:complete len:225 (+) Transcript_118360:1412-2086(+)